MAKPLQVQVARLNYLREMLSKYRAAYYRSCESGNGMSSRMYGWVDEYNELRNGEAWAVYCQQVGFAESHDAYDIFA